MTAPNVTGPRTVAALVPIFTAFAVRESAGHSALYERLSYGIAENPLLARALMAAPVRQQRPNLLFAAAGYVLRTTATDHPIRDWMPTLGGDRPAGDGDPLAALDDLLTTYEAEITALCATRNTQTNEAARACLVRPALAHAARAAGGRPLALIELGTSAGLLLVPDRYAYRYEQGERSETYGSSALTLTCEAQGGTWPEAAGWPLEIASRTGIDLFPIDTANVADVTWLRACIWPEHTARAERLDAALAEVAAVRPVLIQGDYITSLPAALAAVDDRAVPCVFASHALTYVGSAERTAFLRILEATGRERDIAAVVNEGWPGRPNLFTSDVPMPDRGVRTQVTVATWVNGTPSVEVIAEGSAHGTWIEYQPRRYPYQPIV